MNDHDLDGYDEAFQKGWAACLDHCDKEIDKLKKHAQWLVERLDAERQKVADLQELLDKTRKIALELDQKVMRGKA